MTGAEVREGFTVDALERDGDRVVGIRGRGRDGATVVERATVVVGADGRHSTVAEAVGAETYDEQPHLQASYYSYWSGLPMAGRFETFVRPGAAFAAWPTNDDLTLIIAGRPFAEFDADRRDIESTFLATIDLAPAFAERLRAAKRETRFVGTSAAGSFRRPFGPGWVLAGDAGYKSQRDEQVRPFYEFTAGLATLEPPPPEFAQALAGSSATSLLWTFVRVTTGVTSPAEMFALADAGESAA